MCIRKVDSTNPGQNNLVYRSDRYRKLRCQIYLFYSYLAFYRFTPGSHSLVRTSLTPVSSTCITLSTCTFTLGSLILENRPKPPSVLVREYGTSLGRRLSRCLEEKRDGAQQ